MLRSQSLVFVPRMAEVCKECGCRCNSCFNNNSLDLHREIEELKSKVKTSSSHMTQMEHDFSESQEYTEQEVAKLQDELVKLRDRYDRLYESHKKLQKLNHNLEDKLLTIVSKSEGEKTGLQKDASSLNHGLLEAKVTICDLEEECERYRTDCNLAVQLLQCKPSNFVAHKLDTLPLDLQERVKCHMTQQQIHDLEDSSNETATQTETKMIRVPMATFPPTAMVYSINKPVDSNSNPSSDAQKGNRPDTVPTTLIATVLTQPNPERKPRRIFICNKCRTDVMFVDRDAQTVQSGDCSNAVGHNNRTAGGTLIHPGVHRPRLNSTETEI